MSIITVHYIYNEGIRSFLNGLKYEDNPYKKDGNQKLSWSKGYNDMRTRLLIARGQ